MLESHFAMIMRRREPVVLLLVTVGLLILSGIGPTDRLTWALEVAPVVLRGLWYLGAALLAAAAGAGVLWALGGIGEGAFPVAGALQAVVSMAAAGAAMGVVYVAVLWLTRNPELRNLAGPMLRGVGRRGVE